jgi:hypothetical protein
MSLLHSWWRAPAGRFCRPCLCAALVMLAACTPKYDWRTVQGNGAGYTVLLPAKPSSLTRTVNLGGIQASMTMTAAEVDDVTFAVGTAELADPAQAQAALGVMKDTMVRNVGGVVLQQKQVPDPAGMRIDLDAGPPPGTASGTGSGKPGAPAARGGRASVLHARFLTRQRRVYQVIVLGPEKAMRTEAIDTFLTSFKTE